mmetsp:Transcript_41731/g.95779  ORF Transcript_41731/g.95779 Transcript_41731/m.95779 type:complete len:275 (-) Transcript_41731:662-1486(-)
MTLRLRDLQVTTTAKSRCSSTTTAFFLLDHSGVCTHLSLRIEVLNLCEVSSLLNQRLQGRRILPNAIPASRCIANSVRWVRVPFLAFLRGIDDFIHPHSAIPGCVHVLEERLIHLHPINAMLDKPVQQRLGHHWGRRVVSMEPELHTLGIIITAVIREHRVPNPCQVGRLSQVISMSSCPHQDVVSQMSDCIPSLLLRAGEHATKGSNVLVVPCVAISNRRALGYTRYLVTIVPPRHHSRVLGSVLVDPLVTTEVVIDLSKLAVFVTTILHQHG